MALPCAPPGGWSLFAVALVILLHVDGRFARATSGAPPATAAGSSPAAGWHSGESGSYRWTFRESRRLPFGPFGLGEGQHHRTFVWLGSAAAAPQVAMEGLSGGKLRQPLPMPTAWATVGNVLYVGCRNVSCGSWCCGFDDENAGHEVVSTLRDWQHKFPEYAGQPLYLAANWRAGGQLIAPTVTVALAAGLGTKTDLGSDQRDGWPRNLPPLHIAGVLVSAGSSPTAHFFTHSQLETGNGETLRSLRMARRAVSCSEEMDSVKLVMTDAQFSYEPIRGVPSTGTKTVDYSLVSVNTFDRCYGSDSESINDLEKEIRGWGSGADFSLLELTGGMSKRAAYRASLPKDASAEIYPTCESGDRRTQMGAVWDVVGRHKLRLMLLSDQAIDTDIHCSFYIGIFNADGLAWSPQQAQLLGIDWDNRSTHAERNGTTSSPVTPVNDFKIDLMNSGEGEVWVIGEGPIGTGFSSEHGPHGGEGLVSWVRLSPEKVCSNPYCSLTVGCHRATKLRHKLFPLSRAY